MTFEVTWETIVGWILLGLFFPGSLWLWSVLSDRQRAKEKAAHQRSSH